MNFEEIKKFIRKLKFIEKRRKEKNRLKFKKIIYCGINEIIKNIKYVNFNQIFIAKDIKFSDNKLAKRYKNLLTNCEKKNIKPIIFFTKKELAKFIKIYGSCSAIGIIKI